jgi:HlyD family secretion protein
VTLADVNHVWLRAYVNEADVGKIRLGEEVKVTTDSYPGKVYPGRISFISEAAQFTPKSVETHAERVALVYRIRIDVDNPSHELQQLGPAGEDARHAAGIVRRLHARPDYVCHCVLHGAARLADRQDRRADHR